MVQEPAAGFGWYDQQISGAKSSVRLWMYELTDHTVIDDLITDHRRGVSVEVILDRAYHGQETNQDAYEQLSAGGVPVKWGPAGVIEHIKATVIDGTVADISTANLTPKYYQDTTDATVVDRDKTQVTAISRTFEGEWAGDSPAAATVPAAGLVWSPDAQASFVQLIGSARQSVLFTSEELTDRDVIRALEAAARRGVACTIIMSSAPDDATGLQEAGCHVTVLPESATYMHEKALVIDGRTALLGSQNGSPTSLDKNRELGIITTDRTVVQAIESGLDA